jgi:hypothetical protein
MPFSCLNEENLQANHAYWQQVSLSVHPVVFVSDSRQVADRCPEQIQDEGIDLTAIRLSEYLRSVILHHLDDYWKDYIVNCDRGDDHEFEEFTNALNAANLAAQYYLTSQHQSELLQFLTPEFRADLLRPAPLEDRLEEVLRFTAQDEMPNHQLYTTDTSDFNSTGYVADYVNGTDHVNEPSHVNGQRYTNRSDHANGVDHVNGSSNPNRTSDVNNRSSPNGVSYVNGTSSLGTALSGRVPIVRVPRPIVRRR